MPNTGWNTRVMEDGRTWLVWEGQLRVPLDWDPNSGVFIAVTPPGGLANLPALVKGDNGLPPTLRAVIPIELEYYDPTDIADVTEFVLVAEATDSTGPIYDLKIGSRKGAPGEDGGTVLDPSDYGTPVAGRLLAVNTGATDFELVVPTYSGMFWPTTVDEAGAGTTATKTVATISVPANTIPHQWRPLVSGSTRTSGSGPDVRVNLEARLNSASGPIVGLGEGVAAQNDRLILVSGPNVGTVAADITIAANAAATIHFVTAKQGGVDTYASAGSRFSMVPVRV